MKTSEKKAEIQKYYDSKMEFGNIPSFACEWGTKYFYVCRNNGAFHRGDMQGIGGWATFCSKTTLEEEEKSLGIKGSTDYKFIEDKEDLLQYMDVRSPNDEIEIALIKEKGHKPYLILYPYKQFPSSILNDSNKKVLYAGSTYREHFEYAIDELDEKYYINKLIATY